MQKLINTLILVGVLAVSAEAQVLNVPTVEQEQSNWCWAGISKSALDYYGQVMPQCNIVEYARQVSSRNFGNTPCCLAPTGNCNSVNSLYNENGSIQDILNHFGNITSIYKGQFGRTEADVANSIANNAVVPCGWTWTTGGGHAVLIHGYVQGNVYYMDPWFGEGKKIQTYAQFSSGNDGSGYHSWTQGLYFTSDVSQVDTIPCATPTNLVASNATSSSVSLSWNAVGSAQSYVINFREVGTTNWVSVTASTNSKVIGSLSPNTNYEFKVSSSCNSVSQSDFTSTVSASTLEGPVEYCTSKGNSVTGEWIKQVSFGSINNVSNANGGYGNFTSQSTNLQIGASATITLTPGFPSNFLYGTTTQPEFWSVWIDLNQDGDFNDANEQRFVSANSSTTVVSASISVPASALSGTTRMRVAMKRSAAAGPCESFANGEVEDYSINLQAPVNPTCDAVANLSSSGVGSTSFIASWSASANASSYTVEMRPQGGSWASSTVTGTSKAFSGLQSQTTYEVRVTTVCSFGSSPVSNVLSVTTGTAPQAYCSSTGSTANEWIKSVAIGSINNVSNANNGYGNFTNLSTQMTVGQSQNMTLTPGFPPALLYGYITQPEMWSVWIDLNQDGDFDDANEQRFASSTTSTGTVTASISIPSGALSGSTRMRVGMMRNSSPSSCGSFSYGEIEDYTIVITAGLGGHSMTNSTEISFVGNNFKCQVYPNPIEDRASLLIELPSHSKSAEVLILDLSGAVLKSVKAEVEEGSNVIQGELDLSTLASGVYLVHVISDSGERKSLKVTKK